MDAGRSGCNRAVVVEADVDANRADERLAVGMRLDPAFNVDRAEPRSTADTREKGCHEYAICQ